MFDSIRLVYKHIRLAPKPSEVVNVWGNPFHSLIGCLKSVLLLVVHISVYHVGAAYPVFQRIQ